MYLIFESLTVSLGTTRFNIQQFYTVLTLRFCVQNVCQNKQRPLNVRGVSGK